MNEKNPNATAVDVLSQRFAISGAPETPTPSQPPAPDAAMTKRTYYYSRAVADALAAAVNKIHHGSGGKVTKHEALAEIVRAGLGQVDEITRRLTHL